MENAGLPQITLNIESAKISTRKQQCVKYVMVHFTVFRRIYTAVEPPYKFRPPARDESRDAVLCLMRKLWWLGNISDLSTTIALDRVVGKGCGNAVKPSENDSPLYCIRLVEAEKPQPHVGDVETPCRRSMRRRSRNNPAVSTTSINPPSAILKAGEAIPARGASTGTLTPSTPAESEKNPSMKRKGRSPITIIPATGITHAIIRYLSASVAFRLFRCGVPRGKRPEQFGESQQYHTPYKGQHHDAAYAANSAFLRPPTPHRAYYNKEGTPRQNH